MTSCPVFRAARWLTACLLLALPVAHPAAAQTLREQVAAHCPRCPHDGDATGVFVLERGEQALIARAWLTDRAQQSIDVQYFIWSTDNVGVLATEALLRAADRGVAVRVIVDDFLIGADPRDLVAVDAHPNVRIRVYNPQHSVGVSWLQRVWNLLTGFRRANQRMHDKTAIFDGYVGITGGRNMADEYFDYDHAYTFRDRDVLLAGPAVRDMSANFDAFWDSPLSVPVAKLLPDQSKALTPGEVRATYEQMHRYAADPANFAPRVRRMLARVDEDVPDIVAALTWTQPHFVSDAPGKNDGSAGLGGGGASTRALLDALRSARERVLIQSPYFVLDDAALAEFRALAARGVEVDVVTNSLASTDNLAAFSGYHKRRDEILAAGVDVYEFRPRPAIVAELMDAELLGDPPPVFAIHAKTMLVDDRLVYVGSFNLDPRSVNLNTEVGVLVEDPHIAAQIEGAITSDMQPANSWRVTADFDPDAEVGWVKRVKLWLLERLPLTPIL